MAKNQAKVKQQPQVEFWLFENNSPSSSKFAFKNNRFSKIVQENKCTCLDEVIWLMTMTMRLKNKNRIHRYDINRSRPGHGHKYIKCKIGLSIMIVICLKELLSNIWNSICEKIKKKKHWGWVKKKKDVAYEKSLYTVQDILWVKNVNGDLKNWMSKLR